MDKRVSIVVESKALFKQDIPDVESEISELLEEVILDADNEKLYPTNFCIDFAYVITINPSQYKGYSTIRLYNGDSYTVKIDYRKALELFKKSRGENVETIVIT